ncbi:hypothetical protein [Ottowia testudinis]|uniref:Uncharacterized protein n=1 Tax=Ottowia testudinis TaxID=2816950 RepID=A0A975H2A8_9BURK|nr:hypothetical protein [Ottowia testudinis]QTD44599.1 hypothetical protein J1M35_16120 [Ottowia testudinis]
MSAFLERKERKDGAKGAEKTDSYGTYANQDEVESFAIGQPSCQMPSCVSRANFFFAIFARPLRPLRSKVLVFGGRIP